MARQAKRGGGGGRGRRRQRQRQRQRHASAGSDAEVKRNVDELKKRHSPRGKRGRSAAGGGAKSSAQLDAELKADEHGPYVSLAGDGYAVRNSGAHGRLVHKLNARRIVNEAKPDGQLLDSPWQCALCNLGPGRRSMGDLFGPFYVKLDVKSLWPPYLPKPTAASGGHDAYSTDVWLHGQCMIWAPGLLVIGQGLEGAQRMAEYWKRKCSLCDKPGASLSCASAKCPLAAHCHCANEGEWQYRRDTLTVVCHQHRIQ